VDEEGKEEKEEEKNEEGKNTDTIKWKKRRQFRGFRVVAG
jgi:hypothetical protein